MFAFALSEVSLTEIDRPSGALSLDPPGFYAAYAPAPDGGWLVFVRAEPDAVERAQAIARARRAPSD